MKMKYAVMHNLCIYKGNWSAAIARKIEGLSWKVLEILNSPFSLRAG